MFDCIWQKAACLGSGPVHTSNGWEMVRATEEVGMKRGVEVWHNVAKWIPVTCNIKAFRLVGTKKSVSMPTDLIFFEHQSTGAIHTSSKFRHQSRISSQQDHLLLKSVKAVKHLFLIDWDCNSNFFWGETPPPYNNPYPLQMLQSHSSFFICAVHIYLPPPGQILPAVVV
jgi:hypothetical protein